MAEYRENLSGIFTVIVAGVEMAVEANNAAEAKAKAEAMKAGTVLSSIRQSNLVESQQEGFSLFSEASKQKKTELYTTLAVGAAVLVVGFLALRR